MFDLNGKWVASYLRPSRGAISALHRTDLVTYPYSDWKEFDQRRIAVRDTARRSSSPRKPITNIKNIRSATSFQRPAETKNETLHRQSNHP
ncbi:MAG: hypothetical protein WBN04_18840 [Paracoccaceae bacterium]